MQHMSPGMLIEIQFILQPPWKMISRSVKQTDLYYDPKLHVLFSPELLSIYLITIIPDSDKSTRARPWHGSGAIDRWVHTCMTHCLISNHRYSMPRKTIQYLYSNDPINPSLRAILHSDAITRNKKVGSLLWQGSKIHWSIFFYWRLSTAWYDIRISFALRI